MEILNTIFAMDEFKDALPNLFERSANDNLIALIFSITKATLTTSDSMVSSFFHDFSGFFILTCTLIFTGITGKPQTLFRESYSPEL